MENIVYTFSHTGIEQENEKALRYAALAAEKQSALNEVVKFIFDGCHGFNSEISEKTINDAFDCVVNSEKAALYAQEMQKEERERIIQQTELTYNLKKEWFKSLLRVKV